MSIVQVIRPEEVRSVAGGSGIQGREGVIYQVPRNGATLARSYLWDGEKHVELASAASQALVSDAGKISGGVVAIDWSQCVISGVTSGWVIEVDAARTYGGRPTLKIHTNGIAPAGGTSLSATVTLPAPLHLGGAKKLLLPMTADDRGTSGDGNNPVQVWCALSGGQYQRLLSYLSGNGGTDGDWMLAGPYTGDASGSGHVSGTANWALLQAEEVSSVRLVLTCAAGGIPAATPVRVGPLLTDPSSPATLTIYMDGNYAGQYKYARAILAAYRMRASLATIPYWITEGRAGIMTAAQMDAMISDGHEAIHHTGTSGPTGNVDVGWDNTAKYPVGQERALVRADVDASQSYFRARGWTAGLGCGVVGFTAGLSMTQSLTRRQAILAGLRDAGLVHIRQLGGYTQSHFEHAAHPTLTKQTGQIVQNSTAYPTANVQALVDKLVLRGGWTGIAYHDLVLTGEAGNNRSVAAFQADIDYIAAKVADGVLRVLPMSEAAKVTLPAPRG